MTSDYAADTGCPEPYLRRIAEAGFTHVHWCHQWNTDFLYDEPEIEQIDRWLKEYGLRMTDLHASAGREKAWGSAREYERLAGVALVANRVRMTARLGSDVIVMHLPKLDDPETSPVARDQVRRSLDALRPVCRECGVRIAIENGSFDEIEKVLAAYEPKYLGLCYDCGHGNLAGDGLDRLDRLKDRLISVHLHDNDGTADQHLIPFTVRPITGTVDWQRLAKIIAASAYGKCVSMESSMKRYPGSNEQTWLADAFAAGRRLVGMIDQHRGRA